MDATALVIFTDIRGFTSWAANTEVFAHLNEFVDAFVRLVEEHFPDAQLVKPLGDGAMIVQEIDARSSLSAYAALLCETLQIIQRMEDAFERLCSHFAQKVGQKTPLRLGWGIVRGPVKKFDQDYIGPNVNKAARLCDAARPFGIVVDAADFTDKPASSRYQFSPQTRKLTGTGEVEVWVTPEIVSQFVAREKLRQTPEVHIAGMCLDTTQKKTIKLLLAQRSPERSLFPNLIEGCGGQLARSESFMDRVRRHFRQELGIEVRVLEELHCFYEIVAADEALIPGIRFLCERIDDTEPLESPNHAKIWWVSEAEFRRIPSEEFVGNLKKEVTNLLDRFKKTRK